MNDDHDVLFEVRGALGLITLNRPKALNALTLDMCLKMTAQLQAWASDDAVAVVAVQGAGEKGFCAGGDVRALYDSGKAGTPYVFEFYKDEYQLNTLIKEYPKPYVALMDGIAMGGGVGVAVHGSHRVAGDRTLFAMPETGIGLFPDVGGTYFLPRLKGELGMYLGLTGVRLKTADAVHAGVATHYIPSDDHGALVTALAEGTAVDDAIGHLSKAPSSPNILAQQDNIDRVFAARSMDAIMQALDSDGSEWAAQTKATLEAKSPTALKLTYQQIREGKDLSFRACMSLEYRITCRVMEGSDFFEGVRAVVIDKDQKPQWMPNTLAAVSDDDVAAHFAPLGERELTFL